MHSAALSKSNLSPAKDGGGRACCTPHAVMRSVNLATGAASFPQSLRGAGEDDEMFDRPRKPGRYVVASGVYTSAGAAGARRACKDNKILMLHKALCV